MAAFIATGLVVGGSAAWRRLRDRSHEPVRVMLSHSWDGLISALRDFPRADHPNLTIVYRTFRVMVGLAC